MARAEESQAVIECTAKARRPWLRKTLRKSQHEAVASSMMTATSDNFFNAFAVFLQASHSQMGWLTGLPQLFGAFAQIFSVWLAGYFQRKAFIVAVASVQSLIVLLMAAVAWQHQSVTVWWFIALVAGYHIALNLILPHWRAWMGSVVPKRRRGVFFATRTRLTMGTSLTVFFVGGALLSGSTAWQVTSLGFAALFCVAAIGRAGSAWLFSQMHDPDCETVRHPFTQTLRQYRLAWQERDFRQFSVFFAAMHAAVAVSAPFFAVYMLESLHFGYLQFVTVSVASILTQFLTLKLWGRLSDQIGNRWVIIVTATLIPSLPLLWLFSANYYYLLLVQVFSGFAWAGFTLSTANYLYDLRPNRSDFATYAAIQAAVQAALVFVGAIFGGYVASHAEGWLAHWRPSWLAPEPIFVVFIVSTVLRALVSVLALPRLAEPKTTRPKPLAIIFRVARFNAISGVSLDWLTVVSRRKSTKRRQSDD